MQDSMALLALQGDGAATALGSLLPPSTNLKKMGFMTGHMSNVTVGGVEGCKVTRCGYTGEDGFELSVPENRAVELADVLLKQEGVNLAGLGARDSLRLEAGLCLHGNDIDSTTTPVEGGLAWTLGKPNSRRRLEQGFTGAANFLTEEGKLKKVARKRVGIFGMKAPARADIEIYDESGENKIGVVTSGIPSPTLGKPIAMGYVATEHSKAGTKINMSIRGKMKPAEIAKMPFVPTNYYRAEE